jgi:hypothetical protein
MGLWSAVQRREGARVPELVGAGVWVIIEPAAWARGDRVDDAGSRPAVEVAALGRQPLAKPGGCARPGDAGKRSPVGAECPALARREVVEARGERDVCALEQLGERAQALESGAPSGGGAEGVAHITRSCRRR